MKILTKTEFLLKEELGTELSLENKVNEDVLDILKTLMVSNRVKSAGGKLKTQYIEKAKEQISSEQAKKGSPEEVRSKKRIETINNKIKQQEEFLADQIADLNFMKSYVKKRLSIIKNQARLAGYEILDKFYQSDDLDSKIDSLKKKLSDDIKAAEKEKNDISDTQKDEIAKAKEKAKEGNKEGNKEPKRDGEKPEAKKLTKEEITKLTDQLKSHKSDKEMAIGEKQKIKKDLQSGNVESGTKEHEELVNKLDDLEKEIKDHVKRIGEIEDELKDAE